MTNSCTRAAEAPSLPSASKRPDPGAASSVEAIMGRLVAGDEAAVFTLYEHHGNRIIGVIRRQLRRCGVESIARDDMYALALDACMVLRDVAGAWRPGGALPWWWAEGRIRAVVTGWVGVHADSIDDDWLTLAADDATIASTHDEPVAQTFARLVDEVPIVGKLAQAALAARVDDAALMCMLDYAIQQDQGDPSPSHTLAERYGVSPEALRKRVSRSRERLRGVVLGDPQYAELADFVLVA